MPRNVRRAILPLLAATGLCLAGCSAAADVSVVEVGDPPAEATLPGTALSIGDTGWVKVPGASGEEELVGATVLSMDPIDSERIEGFAQTAEVASRHPFAIVVQYTWTPVSEFDSTPRTVPLLPLESDGSFAGWLANDVGNVAMGDADACGLTLPEPKDGTALECWVALTTGPDLGGVEFNGTSRNATFPDEDHPYAEQPVVWKP
jgi:hypothetical protein